MWIVLAIGSAFFLGIYDISKKQSLDKNNVLMVLALNTLFCALLFLPFVILSRAELPFISDTIFYVPKGTLHEHFLVFLKALLVLSSWILSYYGLKYIPITLAGPINATRPVIVLIGALTIFGEQLNVYQWIGVLIAIVSFFMLSMSGKKEGIDFYHNRWVWCSILGTFLGAVSALYDKYLLKEMTPMFVQSWFLLYQSIVMGTTIVLIHMVQKEQKSPFKWRWTIVLISVSLSIADFLYFYSLSLGDSMISIVSMLRRCSVIISFVFGALFLKEKNIRAKAIDLALVLLGLFFLVLGSL